MARRSWRIHTASFAVSNTATYSASHDEVVTFLCFRALQEMIPDPSEKA